jgi:hypothetical protein
MPQAGGPHGSPAAHLSTLACSLGKAPQSARVCSNRLWLANFSLSWSPTAEAVRVEW